MDDALTPGLREELITRALDERLADLPDERVERRRLEPAEGLALVRRHADRAVSEWLRTTGQRRDADHAALVNGLVRHLGAELAERYGLVVPPSSSPASCRPPMASTGRSCLTGRRCR